MENDITTKIIEHPRFTGLWSYRPLRRKRRFCATVIINGEPNETAMFIDWRDALKQAAEIIAEAESEQPQLSRAAHAAAKVLHDPTKSKTAKFKRGSALTQR